ncbi:MAG: DUF262 domain-containing protein [Vampirovibrionales bacterium]
MRAGKENLWVFMSQSKTQYVIPVYQRNYSWQIKHCEKLFDDILTMMNKPNEEYFIGSIVYARPFSQSSSAKQYNIIDGQQRLTTVTLILTALYHLLKLGKVQSSRYSAEQIYENYLIRGCLQIGASS